VFNQATGFLSTKMESRLRPDINEYGVFAVEMIQAGEVLSVWGGDVITTEQFLQLPPDIQRLGIQVEEGLFLVAFSPGPVDYFNHSCDPNAGLLGQIVLVALRDIWPGEEVCFDYAMTDGSPVDEFKCQCGSPHCREQVTGQDWTQPDLWERYDGHFSPYLQRRIERLKQENAELPGKKSSKNR